MPRSRPVRAVTLKKPDTMPTAPKAGRRHRPKAALSVSDAPSSDPKLEEQSNFQPLKVPSPDAHSLVPVPKSCKKAGCAMVELDEVMSLRRPQVVNMHPFDCNTVPNEVSDYGNHANIRARSSP
jgi:hypothetical protein